MTNGFKLIAIKPLDGCSKDVLKVLEEETIYYLHKNYKIIGDSTNAYSERIEIEDILPADLYNSAGIKINVSAIVGKNGSGKSSLVELLYVAIFNLSVHLKLLPRKDEEGNRYTYQEGIRLDLYYSVDSIFYRLRFYDRTFTLFEFKKDLQGFASIEKVEKKLLEKSFFYSLIVNYSHYSLNTKELGIWIKSLFHKNDAYQTPIVLNPFRNEGNIDINIENYLVRSRLLAIIIENSSYNTQAKLLSTDKSPRKLILEVDSTKFQLSTRTGKIVLPTLKNYSHRIFHVLFEIFFDDKEFQPEDNLLNTYAKDYIIRKLKSIVSKYKNYGMYRGFYLRGKNVVLRRFLTRLKDDGSHVSLKLKQAINFLRFEIYPKHLVDFNYDVASLAYQLNELVRRDPTLNLIELVPPSFLKVDIQFNDKTDVFSKLSSGEKQNIYSFSSVIYHLKNIDSTHQGNKISENGYSLLSYESVNIIFDEIELYFHPEFQRTFVKGLLDSVSTAKLVNIKSINFIFITHSPFILSDIPEQSIMFLDLEEGRAMQKRTRTTTFAGNIHELLATNFFLEGGSAMGEFARRTIQHVINWYYEGDKQEAENIKRIISIIDEPIIKVKLSEMYAEKMGENEEMARLEAQRSYIESRLTQLRRLQ